jgi:hypothetical protein
MPALGPGKTSTRHDMSVILVTGSYDHEIRFWEAWSGICSRTITRSGESGVSLTSSSRPLLLFTILLAFVHYGIYQQVNRLAISPELVLLTPLSQVH